MKPSLRKPMGVIAMLLIILVWGFLMVTLSEHIQSWPFAAQAVFYLIAGIAWIYPLRPLLRWMETGKLR